MMPEIHFKDRSIHLLPGRMRTEVFGLKKDAKAKKTIEQKLSSVNGVLKVNACMDTGRVLIKYDEKRITVQALIRWISSIEKQMVCNQWGVTDAQPLEVKEVAVTSEVVEDVAEDQVPEHFKVVPKISNPTQEFARPPFALALSVGGLGVLGIKQLFLGRSAVARSATAFHLAGVVSIVTGYPFLRRGFKKFAQNSKLNPDLILGTSALALALVRENVVVLAGLSVLHYLNWQRSKEELANEETHPSPEIQSYGEKASKLGFILGGAAFALTRDPLKGLAILLAANPRPISMTEEYTWKQAEAAAKQNHVLIPHGGSLAKLAKLKGILIDELPNDKKAEIHCISHEEDQENEEKIWCMAASLVKKADHPWKDQIIVKAGETERTLRTAFCVESLQDGIKGKINGAEVYFGSLPFMQREGIDCSEFLLKAKRLERQGHMVQFVAKSLPKEKLCLGLLVKDGSHAKDAIEHSLQSMDSCNVYVLSNGTEQNRMISHLLSRGEEFVHVKPAVGSLSEFHVPTISIDQLNQLHQSVEYANRIQQTVQQHFQVTKLWNLLGTALALPFSMAAPIINLAADGLTLFFLSRSKRISENYFSRLSQQTNDHGWAGDEVAVTAATTEAPLWHAMPSDQITGLFRVQEHSGLDHAMVQAIRDQYGGNQLSPKQQTPWTTAFLGQFKEFTTLILLGAAGLAFFTGGMFDGLAMGAVLIANAAIGTIQERKAEKVVDALNQFQSPLCKVIRENREMEISGVEIVPGDIVCLEAGDRVPADLRILRAWNLEINEAALTGESLPVTKSEGTHEEGCPLAERKNMLYMGTDVTRGKTIAIVVKTGMETEIGHLMSLMKGEEKQATPLQEKVTSISKTFVKGALVAGGLVFITGMLRGVPLTQLVSTSITLAASAIPEGLPVTITIALSAGIYRMASKNALIRKLSALETLGRTTVICSDKTGTLTKNEMTVKVIATTTGSWLVTGDGYYPEGSFVPVGSAKPTAVSDPAVKDQEFKRLLHIALLCNNSKLEQADDQWVIKGDPTEGALLTLAAKAGLRKDTTREWTRCHEEPFDSSSGMMSVVCKETEFDRNCYLFSKGSVEAILRRCQWYQEHGEVHALTEEKKREILGQTEAFAAEALRVLGFAYSPMVWKEEETNLSEKSLIYIGMVGMIDPPKPDVEKSIRESYELGVTPVMITGDHPITAIAIAKQLGIWDGKREVLTGQELNDLSEQELEDRVEDVAIFARVSPEHKLRIVSAFQKRGHIVAMTGDGVNDSPAIKRANVGIAMGRTGTEVTKETADMVLKEDHFGSIVDGVKEGRTIIGNIRKAIGCLLTGNLAEVLVTSAAVIAGMPMPLVPIQILLMNLLTDALPAMILAINPGDKTKNTKRQDIVDKELYQNVITRGVLLGIGSLGLFAASLAAGAPLAVAQTTAFSTLVAGQLTQTFSWRQEGKEETLRDWTKDRFLIGALGISWAALLTVIYVPPVARIFHAAPLPIGSWLPILAVAGSISLLSKPILKVISGGRRNLNEALSSAIPMVA
jgi:P-type Ca2+ transporter type 2C